MRLKHLFSLCLAVPLAVAATVAHGGDATVAKGAIALELNRLETAGEACRATFVFTNGLDRPLSDVALEVVLFDRQDGVITLLTLEPGRWPAGKTRVRQFDLAATDCAVIGRVLVNDVSRCAGEGLDPDACLDALSTTSRLDIPFSK